MIHTETSVNILSKKTQEFIKDASVIVEGESQSTKISQIKVTADKFIEQDYQT